MVNQLASTDSNDDLSPRLRPILSSLNVNLESELNRYRRDRFTKGAASDDLFADLDDSTFDIDMANITVTSPAANMPSPPPLPPNRRLNGQSLDRLAVGALERTLVQQPVSAEFSGLPDLAASDSTALSSIVNVTAVRTDSAPDTLTPNGYLESSEKLIESLDDLPPMPEPVDIAPKPKRKTVSLLVGAILGLFGLIAGLGVSYIVSSPTMMQKLANLFNGKDETAVVAEAEKTFDPPGPDLSEREFVDLELDNLSSLKMSPQPLDPAANPGNQSLPGLPPTSAQLPPIESQPALPAPSGIQAAVVPAGVTYYVTVPFTTEQDLTSVRATIEEAFVRSFSDGNRIQIAAFDNLAEAQQFVDDVKNQGVTAFVYGPTTE